MRHSFCLKTLDIVGWVCNAGSDRLGLARLDQVYDSGFCIFLATASGVVAVLCIVAI